MKKILLTVFIITGMQLFVSVDPAKCQGLFYEIAETQGLSLDSGELNAKEVIKTIVAAIENYAADNQGFYPENFDDLMGQDPPYLVPDEYEDGIEGYQFSIVTELDSYSVIATPVQCGVTGNKIFTQARGKELSEQLCELTTSP
jgi:hypothetical protein